MKEPTELSSLLFLSRGQTPSLLRGDSWGFTGSRAAVPLRGGRGRWATLSRYLHRFVKCRLSTVVLASAGNHLRCCFTGANLDTLSDRCIKNSTDLPAYLALCLQPDKKSASFKDTWYVWLLLFFFFTFTYLQGQKRDSPKVRRQHQVYVPFVTSQKDGFRTSVFVFYYTFYFFFNGARRSRYCLKNISKVIFFPPVMEHYKSQRSDFMMSSLNAGNVFNIGFEMHFCWKGEK